MGSKGLSRKNEDRPAVQTVGGPHRQRPSVIASAGAPPLSESQKHKNRCKFREFRRMRLQDPGKTR